MDSITLRSAEGTATLSRGDVGSLILNQISNTISLYVVHKHKQAGATFIPRRVGSLASYRTVPELQAAIQQDLAKLEQEFPGEETTTFATQIEGWVGLHKTSQQDVPFWEFSLEKLNTILEELTAESLKYESANAKVAAAKKHHKFKRAVKDSFTVSCTVGAGKATGLLDEEIPLHHIIHKRLLHDQEVHAFFAGVMQTVSAARKDGVPLTSDEYIALQAAYSLLERGYTLPTAFRPLGLPGFRDTQTYLSITDPGEDNIRVTCSSMDLLKGVFVHTEFIDREGYKDQKLMEPYRLPSHIGAAKVRLHTANDAPVTAYIGRPVFENLTITDGKTFHTFHENYAGPDSTNKNLNLFKLDLLKTAHMTASACTAMFANGIADCKISIESMSSSQAVSFMLAVRANVMRIPDSQYLAAAFNINSTILRDDKDPAHPSPVTNKYEIAMLGIDLAKKGGFEKVTWDGASTGKSKPITDQLTRFELVHLVAKAHRNGLVTYISAGMEPKNIADAVYTGVDGIGIGTYLHYNDDQLGMGSFDPERIQATIAARDAAAGTILGTAVADLVLLSRLIFEKSLSLDIITKYYSRLLDAFSRSKDPVSGTNIEEEVKQVWDTTLQKYCADVRRKANETQQANKKLLNRTMFRAYNLLGEDKPVLTECTTVKDWKTTLAQLVQKHDVVGVENFLRFIDQNSNEFSLYDDVSGEHNELADTARSVSLLPVSAEKSLAKLESTARIASRNSEQQDRDWEIMKKILAAHPYPFNAFKETMYTVKELEQVDKAIYDYYKNVNDEPRTLFDRLAMDIHDSSIFGHLNNYVKDKKIIGVMGGHAMKRNKPEFAEIAEICRILASKGFVIVTGGGPGAMEAANLGAYFYWDKDGSKLKDAISLLQPVNPDIPETQDEYVRLANLVLAKYGYPREDTPSLGVPTWLYGHEPFNRFAANQAKFVSNAIREDILLHICNAGMIISTGAGGTRQEIWQYGCAMSYADDDAPQYYPNPVKTVSHPMIFFTDFWLDNKMFQTYKNIAVIEDDNKKKKKGYSSKTFCYTTQDAILNIFENNTPNEITFVNIPRDDGAPITLSFVGIGKILRTTVPVTSSGKTGLRVYGSSKVSKKTGLNPIQKSTLQEILSKADAVTKAGKVPVVELDLDLTSTLPIMRTQHALEEVTKTYKIAAQDFSAIKKLPGYTPEAFREFLKEAGLYKKYPQYKEKAENENDHQAWFSTDNFAAFGTANSSIYSVFHRKFWGVDDKDPHAAQIVEADLPNLNLRLFEKELHRRGGKLVFISGRWLEEQRPPTIRSLLNAGIPEERLHVYVAGKDRGPLSDDVVKVNYQDTVLEKYGVPIAVFDDRKATRDAIVANLSNRKIDALSVGVTIPGFTFDPLNIDKHYIETFQWEEEAEVVPKK